MDLADAIALLRDQVAEAQRRLSAEGDKGVFFSLGEITLELGLELTGSRNLDGGLRFAVVSVGAKAERASKATHQVTVRLEPHGSNLGPVIVADEE
ncbi:trypco2 family protein [Streptomyces sp. DH10]|uniref:trypco2 family protein n=1 Tax=Streptomyces sp. DH10 TaxID=3040121 RepID=UPI002441A9B8|nr:trypco2 family protein [Streptomyces sp. DH10]MDG9714881.1 hypothetical protein [Streptomyces sp. DH10]